MPRVWGMVVTPRQKSEEEGIQDVGTVAAASVMGNLQ
jgi:hypothetical protein